MPKGLLIRRNNQVHTFFEFYGNNTFFQISRNETKVPWLVADIELWIEKFRPLKILGSGSTSFEIDLGNFSNFFSGFFISHYEFYKGSRGQGYFIGPKFLRNTFYSRFYTYLKNHGFILTSISYTNKSIFFNITLNSTLQNLETRKFEFIRNYKYKFDMPKNWHLNLRLRKKAIPSYILVFSNGASDDTYFWWDITESSNEIHLKIVIFPLNFLIGVCIVCTIGILLKQYFSCK
jgi:hypothetical protein